MIFIGIMQCLVVVYMEPLYIIFLCRTWFLIFDLFMYWLVVSW